MDAIITWTFLLVVMIVIIFLIIIEKRKKSESDSITSDEWLDFAMGDTFCAPSVYAEAGMDLPLPPASSHVSYGFSAKEDNQLIFPQLEKAARTVFPMTEKAFVCPGSSGALGLMADCLIREEKIDYITGHPASYRADSRSFSVPYYTVGTEPSTNGIEILILPDQPSGKIITPGTRAKWLCVDVCYFSDAFLEPDQKEQILGIIRNQIAIGRNVLVVFSLSKIMLAPGLRCGFFVLPENSNEETRNLYTKASERAIIAWISIGEPNARAGLQRMLIDDNQRFDSILRAIILRRQEVLRKEAQRLQWTVLCESNSPFFFFFSKNIQEQCKKLKIHYRDGSFFNPCKYPIHYLARFNLFQDEPHFQELIRRIQTLSP